MQPPPRPASAWFGARDQFDYDVFISYRRRDGLKIAEWLSRSLRKYRPPRGFNRQVAALRIFRDLERERVTPAIWNERIRPAVLRSRFLLVVLTPSVAEFAADNSPNWVIREISAFLESPQGSNVMLVRAGVDAAIPKELIARFPDAGWIDLTPSDLRLWRRAVRGGVLRDKLTAVAVPPLDIADEEIPRFTQLAEREKRRIAWTIAMSSLALGVVLSTLAIVAWVQAVAARRAALVRTAESIADSNPTAAALLLTTLPRGDPPEGALGLATRLAGSPLSQVLRGHQLWVSSAVFTPDGTHVATASGDGTIRLWRVDGVGTPLVFSSPNVTAPLGSADRALTSVAVHPDGSSVVAAGAGTVRIWRLDGTDNPRVLRGTTAWVRRAFFNADGSRLLASGVDGTTRVWPGDGSGDPVSLQGEGTAFSPDGSLVVTGSHDGVTRISHADGSGVVAVLPAVHDARAPGGSEFADASFSPDGRAVVAAFGRVACVWRFADSSQALVLRGHEGKVSSAMFSPDSQLVVTSSEDGTARLWPVNGERAPIVLRGHTDGIRTARFSRDGTRVVTASEDRTARVWRVDRPDPALTLSGHEEAVVSATFSPDGRRVLTAGSDRTARVWDVDASDANVVARYAPGTLRYASFDPNGERIVTAHTDGKARLWRIDGQGQPLELTGHTSVVRTASFSSDGRQIVTSGDVTARIWSVADGKAPVILEGHKDTVYSAAFSPDGRLVATASDDFTAAIWSVAGGPPLRLLRHDGDVFSVGFSRDGTNVVTASEDGTARIWRVDREEDPIVIGGHGSDVRGAAFSPDGDRVATGDASGVLRVWRLERPKVPAMLQRSHRRPINAVSVSPDGAHVATASDDGTVRLSRLDRMDDDVVLRHDGPVRSVEFSRDGGRLVTAAADGAVRVWRIDWKTLLDTLQSRTRACLSDEERRRYLGESPAAALRGFDQCEAAFGRPPLRIEYLPSSGELPSSVK